MKKQFLLIVIVLLSFEFSPKNSKLKVDNNQIVIPINKELKISVEINNGNLNNFKLISKSKVKKPIDMMKAFDNIEKEEIVSNEIEIKFCHADFMGSKMVVLKTVHHLEKPIIFKAKIKIKGRPDYIETSIVNKYPNVVSIEQWNDEIESIILFDFTILEE